MVGPGHKDLGGLEDEMRGVVGELMEAAKRKPKPEKAKVGCGDHGGGNGGTVTNRGSTRATGGSSGPVRMKN